MTHRTLTHKGTTVDLDGDVALATYPCGHTLALQQAPADEAKQFGFHRGWWRCPACRTSPHRSPESDDGGRTAYRDPTGDTAVRRVMRRT